MSILKPVLLFEMGTIQVFHYGAFVNDVPVDVFWQCANARKCFGPFPSPIIAMAHLTNYQQAITLDPNYMSLAEITRPNTPANVLHVDFTRKRRI